MGTVRDMVDDSGRPDRRGQTVIVEIKRVVKGEQIVDRRFTSSTDQLRHGSSHGRRRRRMVAVTGLGERATW